MSFCYAPLPVTDSYCRIPTAVSSAWIFWLACCGRQTSRGSNGKRRKDRAVACLRQWPEAVRFSKSRPQGNEWPIRVTWAKWLRDAWRVPELLAPLHRARGDPGTCQDAQDGRSRATRQLPVIVLSGLTSPEDKVRALELGAADSLTKPFHVQELTARIAALLRRTGARSTGHRARGKGRRGVKDRRWAGPRVGRGDR
jgi:hypothetical protein